MFPILLVIAASFNQPSEVPRLTKKPRHDAAATQEVWEEALARAMDELAREQANLVVLKQRRAGATGAITLHLDYMIYDLDRRCREKASNISHKLTDLEWIRSKTMGRLSPVGP
jgi:hypothetical protein